MRKSNAIIKLLLCIILPYASSNSYLIGSSGLQLIQAYFNVSCLLHGCWVVDIEYTKSSQNAVNVLFLPRSQANSDGFYTSEFNNTFDAKSFPCSIVNLDSASATTCCLPDLAAKYRTISSFTPPTECNFTNPPPFNNSDAIYGSFSGMQTSVVTPLFSVHGNSSQLRARLLLDHEELTTQAASTSGSTIVNKRLEIFIGLAQFTPTSSNILDSSVEQFRLSLEKSEFFTVTSTGTDRYTILNYINVVANEVVDVTDSTKSSQYVTISLGLNGKYSANPNTGLIPASSVRIGMGATSADAVWFETCLGPIPALFASKFSQRCAPAASMCTPGFSAANSFITVNIPLYNASGDKLFNLHDTSSLANVFVSFTVSAYDVSGRPVTTTVNAELPIRKGGVNSWCYADSVSSTLADVLDNVAILVGSAGSTEEISRLTGIANIQSGTQNLVGSLDSKTIESGLVTLAVQGKDSYFNLDGNTGLSLKIEHSISFHIMGESQFQAVNAIFNNASVDAVNVVVDQINQKATLVPSNSLAALCLGTANPLPQGSCVLRHDIQGGIPERSTAYEIMPGQTSTASDFIQGIMGTSKYAADLGANFSRLISSRYGLSPTPRSKVAYWLNPGYSWSGPGGSDTGQFTLSQRVIIVSLIVLDGGATGRRRFLLQSGISSPPLSSAARTAMVQFGVEPATLLASSLGVNSSKVSTWNIRMQLNASQACMLKPNLGREMRTLLLQYLAAVANPVADVAFVSITVNLGSVSCGAAGKRAATFTGDSEPATGTFETIIILSNANSQHQFIDVQALLKMPGILSITPISVPAEVLVGNGVDDTAPATSPIPSSQDKLPTYVIVTAAAGGVFITGLVVAARFMISRRRIGHSKAKQLHCCEAHKAAMLDSQGQSSARGDAEPSDTILTVCSIHSDATRDSERKMQAVEVSASLVFLDATRLGFEGDTPRFNL